MFGRNDNPCGYDALLITLLFGNDLVHFPIYNWGFCTKLLVKKISKCF